MRLTYEVPENIQEAAAAALEEHEQGEKLLDVHGVSIAKALKEGVATLDDIRKMGRFFAINERNKELAEQALHTTADDAYLRSWKLHGGDAAHRWVESVRAEAIDAGLLDETDDITSLLNAEPDEVYNAFQLDAWRWEYGLTPEKAARFCEDYVQATGTQLDYRKAFGESAGAVGNAIFRRYHTAANPLVLAARLMGESDDEVSEYAREDLNEMANCQLDEHFWLDHGKKPKTQASKAAWPIVVAYYAVHLHDNKLLKALFDKPVPELTQHIHPPKYNDLIQVYSQFLHPGGKHYVDPAATDFATLPEALYTHMSKMRLGQKITTSQTRAFLLTLQKWAAKNKWQGTIFKSLVNSAIKGDLETIKDALDPNSDIYPLFLQAFPHLDTQPTTTGNIKDQLKSVSQNKPAPPPNANEPGSPTTKPNDDNVKITTFAPAKDPGAEGPGATPPKGTHGTAKDDMSAKAGIPQNQIDFFEQMATFHQGQLIALKDTYLGVENGVTDPSTKWVHQDMTQEWIQVLAGIGVNGDTLFYIVRDSFGKTFAMPAGGAQGLESANNTGVLDVMGAGSDPGPDIEPGTIIMPPVGNPILVYMVTGDQISYYDLVLQDDPGLPFLTKHMPKAEVKDAEIGGKVGPDNVGALPAMIADGPHFKMVHVPDADKPQAFGNTPVVATYLSKKDNSLWALTSGFISGMPTFGLIQAAPPGQAPQPAQNPGAAQPPEPEDGSHVENGVDPTTNLSGTKRAIDLIKNPPPEWVDPEVSKFLLINAGEGDTMKPGVKADGFPFDLGTIYTYKGTQHVVVAYVNAVKGGKKFLAIVRKQIGGSKKKSPFWWQAANTAWNAIESEIEEQGEIQFDQETVDALIPSGDVVTPVGQGTATGDEGDEGDADATPAGISQPKLPKTPLGYPFSATNYVVPQEAWAGLSSYLSNHDMTGPINTPLGADHKVGDVVEWAGKPNKIIAFANTMHGAAVYLFYRTDKVGEGFVLAEHIDSLQVALADDTGGFGPSETPPKIPLVDQLKAVNYGIEAGHWGIITEQMALAGDMVLAPTDGSEPFPVGSTVKHEELGFVWNVAAYVLVNNKVKAFVGVSQDGADSDWITAPAWPDFVLIGASHAGEYPFPRLNYMVPDEHIGMIQKELEEGALHNMGSYLVNAPSVSKVLVGSWAKAVEEDTEALLQLVAWVRRKNPNGEEKLSAVAVTEAGGMTVMDLGEWLDLLTPVLHTATGLAYLDGDNPEITFGKGADSAFSSADGSIGPDADLAPISVKPIKQTPFKKIPKGKHLCAGVIAYMPSTAAITMGGKSVTTDGLFYVLYRPTGAKDPTQPGHGGYHFRLPSARIRDGESIEYAAQRAAKEHLGLNVELVRSVGDFEGDAAVHRMFIARVTSGNPTKAGKGTDGVVIRESKADPGKLTSKSGNDWQVKAIDAALSSLLKNKETAIDNVPSEEGDVTALASVQVPEFKPPFPVPGVKIIDEGQAPFSVQAVANKDASVVDYDVDTEAPYTDGDESGDSVDTWFEEVLGDQDDWESWKWVPYLQDLGGNKSVLNPDQGPEEQYPPPGAGFTVAVEGGEEITAWCVGYIRAEMADGSKNLYLAYRNKNDFEEIDEETGEATVAIDFDVLILTENASVETPPEAFKPLGMSTAIAAAEATTEEDTWALLADKSQFPIPPEAVDQIKSFAGSKGLAKFKYAASYLFLDNHPAPGTKISVPINATLIGYLSITGAQDSGPNKGQDRNLNIALFVDSLGKYHVLRQKEHTEWGIIEAADDKESFGTHYAFHTHPKSLINAGIKKIAYGSTLDSVGMNPITFKQYCEDAGMEAASYAPSSLIPVMAQSFVPGMLKKGQYTALLKVISSKAKAKKKPAAKAPVDAPKKKVKTGAVGGEAEVSFEEPSPVVVTPKVGFDYQSRKDYLHKLDASKLVKKGNLGGGSTPNLKLNDPETGLNFIAKGLKGVDNGNTARLHAEEAASKLFGLVTSNTNPVRVVEFEGKKWALQPLWEGEQSPVPDDPTGLDNQNKVILLQQHALDMFTQDHDGNPSNWILVNGKLRPIDKGQSFRFFTTNKMAPKLDPKFTPSGVHGQAVTKTLLLAYAKDPSVIPDSAFVSMRRTIADIQSIPDVAIEGALQPLFDALDYKPKKRAEVIADVVAWRDNYFDAWTKALKKLNKLFAWPETVPVKSAPVQVLDASPEQFGMTEEEALDIKKAIDAKWAGRTVRVDKASIENQEVWVKHAKMKDDSDVTILTWKVTEYASVAAVEALNKITVNPMSVTKGGGIGTLQPIGVQPSTTDSHNGFADAITKAVKTVNFHLNKAIAGEENPPKFNQDTLTAVDVLTAVLTALQDEAEGKLGSGELYKVKAGKAGAPKDAPEAVFNMAGTYLQWISEIKSVAAGATEPKDDWKSYPKVNDGAIFSPFTFDYDAWLAQAQGEEVEEPLPQDLPNIEVDFSTSTPGPDAYVDDAGIMRIKLLEASTSQSLNHRGSFRIGEKQGGAKMFFSPVQVGGAKTWHGFCWAYVPGTPSPATVKRALALFEVASQIPMRPSTKKDREALFWSKQSAAYMNVKSRRTIAADPNKDTYDISVSGDLPEGVQASLPAGWNGAIDPDKYGVRHNGRVLVRGEHYEVEGTKILIKPSYQKKINAGDTLTVAEVAAANPSSAGSIVPTGGLQDALNTYMSSDPDQDVPDEVIEKMQAFLAQQLGVSVSKLQELTAGQIDGQLSAVDGEGGYRKHHFLGWTSEAYREAWRKINGGKEAMVSHSGNVDKMILGGVPMLAPTANRLPFYGVPPGGGAGSGSQSQDANNGGGDHAFTNAVHSITGGSGYLYFSIDAMLETDTKMCGTGDSFANLSSTRYNTPEVWLEMGKSMLRSQASIGSSHQIIFRHGIDLRRCLFIIPSMSVVQAREALKQRGITKFAFGRGLEDVVVTAATAKKKHAALKL